MSKWFMLLVFLSAVPSAAECQEPWDLSVDANLTFTENAYSENWAGGEAGAVTWLFNSNSLAQKQLNSKTHNRNSLKLFFGQTHSQDPDTNDWNKPVVSNDLIDFETVFRFTLGWWAEPYLAGRIESQFLDTSDPEKNRYLNPAKFTESGGVAKVLIKDEKTEWTTRLGAGVRQYLNRDVLNPLTSERENLTGHDAGVTLDSEIKTNLAGDQITVTSKLTVFNALTYSKEDEVDNDYWKYPDVNWETIFTAGITKYLMINLYLQILYDKEIDLGGRFKQSLSVGLTYKFI